MNESVMSTNEPSNYPTISVEEAKNKNSTSKLTKTPTVQKEIKKDYTSKDIGHFILYCNNTIVINFIDKVKLYMDDYSMQSFVKKNYNKSFCSIYLTDNSHHEICLTNVFDKSEDIDDQISPLIQKYLNFLKQWLQWLIDSNHIKQQDKEKEKEKKVNYLETVGDNMESHLNKLKLFNYTLSQDRDGSELTTQDSLIKKYSDQKTIDYRDETTNFNQNQYSISNLLKENQNFLKNLTL
jgi:hypothetical protein